MRWGAVFMLCVVGEKAEDLRAEFGDMGRGCKMGSEGGGNSGDYSTVGVGRGSPRYLRVAPFKCVALKIGAIMVGVSLPFPLSMGGIFWPRL